MNKTLAVIGAGSWGTALAAHAFQCGLRVRLWAHSEDTLRTLQEKRVNTIYLPEVTLPQEMEITSEIGMIRGADYALFAVPSFAFRSTFEKFLPEMQDRMVLISAMKGMEPESSLRISEIVNELSGDRFVYSVLSGPSFAQEVARQHPTAVVIASTDAEIGRQIQNDLRSPYFRLYYNADVLGVELGGSIKNTIALGAGVVSGLGYGYNTLAGLITRGLAEMNRLAVRLGAHPSTLSGLAGLGDLILTCTGSLSRNRQVGIELGKGKKIEEITAGMRQIAEGVRTTKAIRALAQKLHVGMPITEEVYKVIYENHDPRSAILELMSRELKEESL